MILPAGKPGVVIDRKRKSYIRQPARLGYFSPLMALDKLSTFSGHADRDLGTRQIEGKQARGFEIEARKIDPDSYSGSMEIWLDAATNLPLLLRYELKGASAPGTIRMTDFHWNVDLDPKLFDPTPPEGFAEDVRRVTAGRTGEEDHGGTEGLRQVQRWALSPRQDALRRRHAR